MYGYDQRQLHRRLPRSYRPESPQQEAARVALEAKRDTLNAAHEAAQDGQAWDKAEQISGQITANETQIAALQDSRLDLTALDMTLAGAVVTVLNGSVMVYRGLALSPHAKNQHGESDPHGRNGNGSDPRPRPEVPEKLMLNLSSHRTAAIQALMLGNPQVTLAALAHRMAITVLRPHDFEGHTIKLKLVQCRSTLEKNAPTLPNSRAVQALNRQREDWLARLPAESCEWFDWLLVQTQDTVLALIVFASAQSAEAVQVSAQGDDASAPLARALSLDMADWWEATPENYLGLVPKAKLMEAVTETAGEQVAAAMLKMKKDGAIAHASQHVLGRRWLPAPLRSIPVASSSAVEFSQVGHAVEGEV